MELVRRKRVNEDGDWEYECSVCKNWLPKPRFRGCKNYVDAYGNCLMCSSCRGRLSQETRLENYDELCNDILIACGYDPSSEKPVWQQFHDRHNLKY